MIVSASRRTDIPAFYSDWFMDKIGQGFSYVMNPFNRKQVNKIILTPDTVKLLCVLDQERCSDDGQASCIG